MKENYFYSNGKLLLTGEYLVLRGAEALAMPVRFGQSLEVSTEKSTRPLITWETFVENQLWQKLEYTGRHFLFQGLCDDPVYVKLRKYLNAAKNISGKFPEEQTHYKVKTDINFDISWGLGSSSSLIANIGKWLQIDPMEIFRRTENGSGYDIACALSDSPIIYKTDTGRSFHEIRPVELTFPFQDQIYFVYSGQKAVSAQKVQSFNENSSVVTAADIENISSLSREMAACKTLDQFEKIIKEHENITGTILKEIPVKNQKFSDFEGAIKSLGAWGGDFLMVTTPHEEKYLREYFSEKGLTTFFPYSEMVLKKSSNQQEKV